MKGAVTILLIWLFVSCNNSSQQSLTNDTVKASSDTLQKTSSANAYSPSSSVPSKTEESSPDIEATIKFPSQHLKNPSGFYQALIPYNDSGRLEQTVKFFDDHTYRLQEKVLKEKNDSTIITEGTWTPSNGFIWLYKDQVVRARYKWKGDTLQYFDPSHKKNFAMHELTDVMSNDSWKTKKEQGIVLYGIGNEPFWSLEYTNKDTINFVLAEGSSPLQMKVTSRTNANDTTIYLAQNDSAHLKLLVLPYFCTDGMSNNVYKNKMQVQYNHKTYNGCGVMY